MQETGDPLIEETRLLLKLHNFKVCVDLLRKMTDYYQLRDLSDYLFDLIYPRGLVDIPEEHMPTFLDNDYGVASFKKSIAKLLWNMDTNTLADVSGHIENTYLQHLQENGKEPSAEVRELLLDFMVHALTSGMSTLALDIAFNEVHAHIRSGMTNSHIANMLIDHFISINALDELVQKVAERNPFMFGQFKARLMRAGILSQ